ncbi:MAG: hypothetical protein H0V11_08660 [Actinobacteria bacterium]|nr:hypothetical protein [Actinomycetota bacterium]
MAVKGALIALLLFAVFSGAHQFQGKAMEGRALTYPLAALIVPLGWWLWGRRDSRLYPYALDIFLVLPFLIDTAGNALDLYDTIDWWDDFNHLLNWGLLTAACGQLLLRYPLGRLNVVSLAIGFGAVTALLWEIGEYYTFIRGGPEEQTAYTDTLGDMTLGLVGSVVRRSLR